jgi:cytochrome c oxidase assembly protein subunit 11
MMDRKVKIALFAALAPTFMFGMAWASVPLYQLFCQVTGYGGTTQIATKAADEVLDQTVKVRFDANVAPGIPWDFAPQDKEMTIKLGENGLAFYTVTNTSDKAVTAVATYNVTPFKTGPYFQKLECFCFQDRTLQPGETMELPVIFYVDPKLASDTGTDDVTEITLSYTFFPADQQIPNTPVQAAVSAKTPS